MSNDCAVVYEKNGGLLKITCCGFCSPVQMSACSDGCGSSVLEKVINHSAASAQNVMSHFSRVVNNPSYVHLGSEKGVDTWF